MLKIHIDDENQEKLALRAEKEKPLKESEGIYGVTGYYLTKEGRPWYPVMGEFHFSRFCPSLWREEIGKMKAGGIEVVATYVFWLYHEEKQGEWDFEGQKNLRHFLEICRQEQMPVFLRIGPWAHGECRNGGFPDWLLNRGLGLRSDDPGYLALAENFWRKIHQQADGFFYHQGGPVIGIQIENEYGHAGGLQGEAGMQHMRTLKKMAVKLGFVTPYYTATGWGGGNVPQEECVPVLAGYCGAPWAQHTGKMPLNGNFVFTLFKDDTNVGSDLKSGEETGFTYDTEKMPYLMAELGGGLQVTGHRRPYVSAADTAAMALCKAGSGANLLGYYMYHGGTNPMGKYSTFQESRATGYCNDLPIRSYDFQAPIGEYGSIHESYYALRPLHMFLRDFGEILAQGDTILPPWNSEHPDETDGIRISVRHVRGKGQGFLFYNRYQRHAQMTDRSENFEIEENQYHAATPRLVMKGGTWGWIPYAGSETEGMELTPEFYLYSSNYIPLCRLGKDVVFFGEGEPEIQYRGEGKAIYLTRKEAEHSLRYKENLYTGQGCLLEEKGHLYLLTGKEENCIKIYPRKDEKIYRCEKSAAYLTITEKEKHKEYIEYRVSIEYGSRTPHDLWLILEFNGDRGEFWMGDTIKDPLRPDGDWFYQGAPWKISLRYFDWPQTLTIKIYPKKSPEEVYYEFPPTGSTRIAKAALYPEYKIQII